MRHLAQAFDAAQVRYFVTGSMATIFYGEPRLTNDIDVVADLNESAADRFCRQFPPDEYYLSEPAAREAITRGSQFNIIHLATGLKIDVIVPRSTPFNQSRFERLRKIRVDADTEVSFASPEDAIIKKMDFYRLGGSDKHLRDITGVIATSRDQLDFDYINHWARELGLSELWETIQRRAAESE